ncbi:DISP complex protein LRCH3-like [Mantella aurantiaca]
MLEEIVETEGDMLEEIVETEGDMLEEIVETEGDMLEEMVESGDKQEEMVETGGHAGRDDLSKNRFCEIPGELCQLVSLESLNLYHNCLRTLPPCISNLQALTYLNISRNLLTSLPPYLCRLPLTVLIASNNKLNSIPEEVSALTNLRQLDISCNEIQSLPPQMGSLESLRELNVRRNQLTSLPEELSELPLIRLDISCNRISHIPVCYRHLRHLQTIILDNNPLQYPPAQICLKGKVHIFKYLNIEACSKPAPELADLEKLSRPTSFTTCLTDDVYSSRPYGCLDSGFNSVDSGSKRWSGNERDLCSASDILGGRSPDVIQRMVSSLLLLLASSDTPTISPNPALSEETAMCSTLLQLLYQHHGFLLFYALLMLAFCVAYNKLSVL